MDHSGVRYRHKSCHSRYLPQSIFFLSLSLSSSLYDPFFYFFVVVVVYFLSLCLFSRLFILLLFIILVVYNDDDDDDGKKKRNAYRTNNYTTIHTQSKDCLVGNHQDQKYKKKIERNYTIRHERRHQQSEEKNGKYAITDNNSLCVLSFFLCPLSPCHITANDQTFNLLSASSFRVLFFVCLFVLYMCVCRVSSIAFVFFLYLPSYCTHVCVCVCVCVCDR